MNDYGVRFPDAVFLKIEMRDVQKPGRFFAGARREDSQRLPGNFNEEVFIPGVGVDVGNEAGTFPCLREGEHAPAVADVSHLGNVPVDEDGGASVEGVQAGALEEFRAEFPGVQGDAFHSLGMGEIPASRECLFHARDGWKMLWEKPNVSGLLMFSSAFV